MSFLPPNSELKDLNLIELGYMNNGRYYPNDIMDWLQQASQDIYGTSYEEQVRKYSAFRLNQYLEAAGVTDYQVDENGDKAFNYKKIAALLSD